MKVQIIKDFKSIKTSTKIDCELPDFTLIAGENGSGKSHFLEAIKTNSISLIIDKQKLTLNNVILENYITIQSKTKSTNNNSYIDNYAIDLHSFSYNNSNHIRNGYKGNLSEDLDTIKKCYKTETPDQNQIRDWATKFIYPDKPFESHRIKNIFELYAEVLGNNFVQRDGKEENYTDKEFIEMYGEKPWDILNGILHEKIGLKINFKTPNKSHPSELDCTNENNDEFKIDDLSNGEKVLLSIAMSLFSLEKNQFSLPDLILLDEVDSCLHPSMIKKLLELINEVFVKEYKIKVILVTHSPTTVALTDEESIFYMTSNNDNRLIKESKDYVLKQLSYGIPTLSVTYSNRRDVFTESKNDFDAYNLSKIYQILSDNQCLETVLSLNFIAAGLKESNSEEVQYLVNKTEASPNIYGIIDWDLKNKSNDKLLVLGEGKYYSIENCILDPLLIAILLLHEIDSKVTPESLGLPEKFNLNAEFKVFTDKAQEVANNITNMVSEKILDKDKSELIEITYSKNDIKVNVPKWYLETRGHDLESNIKSTFPSLNRFRAPNDLKNSVIKIMGKYALVPNCFLDIMKKII